VTSVAFAAHAPVAAGTTSTAEEARYTIALCGELGSVANAAMLAAVRRRYPGANEIWFESRGAEGSLTLHGNVKKCIRSARAAKSSRIVIICHPACGPYADHVGRGTGRDVNEGILRQPRYRTLRYALASLRGQLDRGRHAREGGLISCEAVMVSFEESTIPGGERTVKITPFSVSVRRTPPRQRRHERDDCQHHRFPTILRRRPNRVI